MELFEDNQRTEISSLGEFGLIAHLTQSFENKQTETIMGIGDDAAVLANGSDEVWLVSTDQLLEGVHFDLAYTPLKHLGYKAIASSASDICAMNGRPTHALVSIGSSNRFSVEALTVLYEGIHAACRQMGLDLIGGDTSSSRQGLSINVTVLGRARKDEVVYRSGTQPNDLLCVTGDLGGAYIGLQLLEREKQVFLEAPTAQPDLAGHDYILQRQLRPEARTDIKALLERAAIKPKSMIDISDGLSSELHHLAKASGVGFTVYEDKLPIDPTTYQTARDLGLEGTLAALHGGEDYELLFTIAQSDYEKLGPLKADITVIGHATEAGSGIKLVTKSGQEFTVTSQGWENFTASEAKQ